MRCAPIAVESNLARVVAHDTHSEDGRQACTRRASPHFSFFFFNGEREQRIYAKHGLHAGQTHCSWRDGEGRGSCGRAGRGVQEGLPVLDGSDRGGDSLRSHTGPAARSCNLSMSEKDLDDFDERYRTKSTIFAGKYFLEK